MAKRFVLKANGSFLRIGSSNKRYIAIARQIVDYVQEWDEDVPAGVSIGKAPLDRASVKNTLLSFAEPNDVGDEASVKNTLLSFEEPNDVGDEASVKNTLLSFEEFEDTNGDTIIGR